MKHPAWRGLQYSFHITITTSVAEPVTSQNPSFTSHLPNSHDVRLAYPFSILNTYPSKQWAWISWVPARWGEQLGPLSESRDCGSRAHPQEQLTKIRPNWPQHTHQPTTHRSFQSGWVFKKTASTKIFTVSFEFPQLAVTGFNLFLIMEKNPAIGSEWRNLSLALPFLKHQCLHEFLGRELDFLSYFALKKDKDQSYFACTESHTEI